MSVWRAHCGMGWTALLATILPVVSVGLVRAELRSPQVLHPPSQYMMVQTALDAVLLAAGKDRGVTGVCCLLGQCLDDTVHDTLAECEADGGVFIADASCQTDPCPVCPFNTPSNCQQVQTIFGQVPSMDRNPLNGTDGETAEVIADDVKFGGDIVDRICWNTSFFQTPCCQNQCVQNIDDTWEIRIYETDVDCSAIPGVEVGMSTVAVLGKIEGAGQATGTWFYSGRLDTPIALPNGGLTGDTYWFEVSGFGEPGCQTRAIWSRDDGNKHHAVSSWTAPEPAQHTYSTDQIGSVDVGFCEDDGLGVPDDVLGACCTCPSTCQDNVSRRDCNLVRGDWKACANCGANPCREVPPNDDCASPLLITGIPTDGSELLIEGHNICATDDGPGLKGGDGGCAGSIGGGADLHNDVWWEYTAEDCGDLRVHSCNDADYDQMIAIYDATAGCPLTSNEEVNCDDDTCGIGAGPSDVTIAAVQGTTYLIRVGGWNNEWGSFIDNPRGFFMLHITLDRNCPPVDSPTLAPPPHDILKNRYISIVPGNAEIGAFDIRLTLANTLVNGVTAIGSQWWANAPDANCISIVGPTQPATPPNWDACPTLHLTGCPIIPTSTYNIWTVWDLFLSDPPLAAQTQAKPGDKWYGDVVGAFTGTEWEAPNGVVSIDDALAAIKTFQDINAINATHLTRSDVEPNRPDLLPPGNQINKVVNIADVLSIIIGFQGKEYPGPQIDLCPDP